MGLPLHSQALADRCGVVQVAGTTFVVDPSGALFYPDSGVLVVADLHFEKGSAFAARRQLLPPYDTAATLARLAAVVHLYQPRVVVALGDSFHDNGAPGRMSAADASLLQAIQGRREWIWVAGNHDPAPPANVGGQSMAEFCLGTVVLRHEPQANLATGEIAGHLHPVARVSGRGSSLRRRCFISDGRRMVMPAFGAYAGGLNIRDRAYDGMFAHNRTIFVLGRERIYAVAMAVCHPD